MPRGSEHGPSIEVRLEPRAFAQMLREVRGFDRALATATRKRLREAADPAVKAIRARIRGGGFRTDVGLAKGLAAGTKLSIRTGQREPGVTITTTASKLPAGKAAMVHAFNKHTFRHPVGGNRDVWVNQRGRPYFGSTIAHHERSMREGMEQAIRDAAATIKSGDLTT
jgi:hypothetical protein